MARFSFGRLLERLKNLKGGKPVKRLWVSLLIMNLMTFGLWEVGFALSPIETELVEEPEALTQAAIRPIALTAAPQLEGALLQWGVLFIEQNRETIGKKNLSKAQNCLKKMVPDLAGFLKKYAINPLSCRIEGKNLIAEFDLSPAGSTQLSAQVRFRVEGNQLLFARVPSVKGSVTLRRWDAQEQVWQEWRTSPSLSSRELLAQAGAFLDHNRPDRPSFH